MAAEPKIQCVGLWKLYGRDPAGFLARHDGQPTLEHCRAEGYIAAVRAVSFTVPAGEILVVMGLSGSGKSTLVRCLSRLIEPTTGQILFEGQDITHADERALIELRRHKMGMVFQNFGLLPHRTAVRNVTFPLEIQGVARAERESKATELMNLVGLEGRGGYFPRELSGGQQQRVGIARSLAVEPDLWFLDEPFSALDPLIRTRLQDELLELQHNLKRTIIFVSHDLDEAFKIGDRIAILEGGRIVQCGTPRDIIRNPADAYVADFVEHINPLRVLRASDVMSDGEPGADWPSVQSATPLEEVMAGLKQNVDGLRVTGSAGDTVGIVRNRDVIAALAS
jgi:glycine betaine/proline transport system ATP-binding protein